MRALRSLLGVWFAIMVCMGSPAAVLASDHGDTPTLIGAGRHDARITDLFAFRNGDDLVLIVDMNPAIPLSVSTYQYPSDLVLKINIDNDSSVSFNNASDLTRYGGTIDSPAGILEDVVFTFTFPSGTPQLATTGLAPGAESHIQLFSGLRDDPFIRGPQIGKDIAAIVVELPLSDVLASQSTILVWATSFVDDFAGPFQDLAGRSFRSQQAPFMALNAMHPSEHLSMGGATPDVMIYDTSKAAVFPNGRRLADDVLDMVYSFDPALVQGVMNTDAPFPSENDKLFNSNFPYLATPHRFSPIPAVSTWGILALTLLLAIAAKVAAFPRRDAAA